MNTRLLAVPLLLALPAAQAATYTVTRFDDPAPNGCARGDCSLREAVSAARSTAASDSIVLAIGTYKLTRVDPTPDTAEPDRGSLYVSGGLTITGASTTRTHIAWATSIAHENAVFKAVTDGTQLPFALQLSNLTMSGGKGTQGGCIHAGGQQTTPPQLVLEGVVVEGCSSREGGAIHMHRGALALRNTTLRGNHANWGGALDLKGRVDVETQNTDIVGNEATQGGGAVRVLGIPILPLITDVVWVDDGNSRIRDNRTDGRGGGLLVSGPASLHMSTIESAAATQMLTISGNQADDVGGGLAFDAIWFSPEVTNWLQRVRFEGNAALAGGGIHAHGAINIADSEIADNHALAGNGGGIAFTGDASGTRELVRVSLRDNEALAGAGGGLSSECSAITVQDTAIHGNRAAGSRGQGVDALGALDLRHVTIGNGSGAVNSPGLRKRHAASCSGHALRIANSLLVDGCSAVVASELVSDGGNQLGPEAITCPELAGLDQRQSQTDVFGLTLGTYGGDFVVPGWPLAPQLRPQRDFGLSSACSATDIRGMARSDGACDAGAYEHQEP